MKMYYMERKRGSCHLLLNNIYPSATWNHNRLSQVSSSTRFLPSLLHSKPHSPSTELALPLSSTSQEPSGSQYAQQKPQREPKRPERYRWPRIQPLSFPRPVGGGYQGLNHPHPTDEEPEVQRWRVTENSEMLPSTGAPLPQWLLWVAARPWAHPSLLRESIRHSSPLLISAPPLPSGLQTLAQRKRVSAHSKRERQASDEQQQLAFKGTNMPASPGHHRSTQETPSWDRRSMEHGCRVAGGVRALSSRHLCAEWAVILSQCELSAPGISRLLSVHLSCVDLLRKQ